MLKAWEIMISLRKLFANSREHDNEKAGELDVKKKKKMGKKLNYVWGNGTSGTL